MSDRLRRTMMYVPGNTPGLIRDAAIFGADSIMFDLEDSISINEKDSARFLVFNALTSLDFGDLETVVRINGLDTPFGREDLEAIVRARPHIIRIPKTETAEDVIEVDEIVTDIEEKEGIPIGTVQLLAALESVRGIVNVFNIVKASSRLVAIALGAEDYVTDLKTERYYCGHGEELAYARSQVVVAARLAGLYALDTVYSDLDNMEKFEEEVRLIKQMGFDGKSVIHPKQIAIVHKLFTPDEKQINRAVKILKAMEEAKCAGTGVIAVDGKMVDEPMVIRAKRVLQYAEAAGKLREGEVSFD